MACPPDWPGYQASSRARAFCWAQFTARALPLSRTTTIGLPVLATASSISCWTSGRVDVGAVSAGEALGVHFHLFAFEARGEADEGDDDVGFLCGCDGLVLKELVAGAPFEGDSSAVDAAGLDVLDAEVVRAGVGEGDGEVLDGSVVAAGGRELAGGRRWRSGGHELFAVEVEGEFHLVAAGIAERQAELEVERFGDGRGDGADPANGEGLGGGVGGLDGIGECPVEVDFLVDADHFGCAVERWDARSTGLPVLLRSNRRRRGTWCAARGVRRP